ncbi:hypothetical protein [uncultured Selenomonas sp.]|nr:hypothetical protein [uncultured Selenomonas sp.]
MSTKWTFVRVAYTGKSLVDASQCAGVTVKSRIRALRRCGWRLSTYDS